MLQADYNLLEDSAEYDLLYLEDLAANNIETAIIEFLIKQSEYEIANLLESILIQDRLLIWEQIPEALKDEVLGELEFDTRQQLIESIDVIRDIRFYPRP